MEHISRAVSRSLTIALFVLFASATYGAVFTVTNTNDSGAGSLRQAIADANFNSQDDTIAFDASVFNVPRVILLTTGEIFIGADNPGDGVHSLTISGPGANVLEINGNDHSRIFRTAMDAVAIIDGVKLSGGNGTINGEIPDQNSSGGAIYTSGGGGGVVVTLLLKNSIVANNRSTLGNPSGGAITAFGRVQIVNCAIYNNTSVNGGALSIPNSRVEIFNSTIAQNSSSFVGAIVQSGGELHLTNTTIARNVSTRVNGIGGILATDGGPFTGHSVFMRNSIIANNTSIDIASSQLRSRGNNIFGTSVSIFESSPTDLFAVDPMLEGQLKIGSGIPHFELATGSPAVDSGDNCVLVVGACSAHAIVEDARGVVRPQDGDSNGTATIDRGTFEVTPAEAAAAPGAPDLDVADDTGISSTDNITSSSAVTLHIGNITPGATVELFRNHVMISSVVAAGASISYEDSLVTNGRYYYTARQIIDGVPTLKGGVLSMVFDNVGPTGTLNQAVGQADPTRFQPLNYTLIFSEPVFGLDLSEFNFTGSSAGIGSVNLNLTPTAPLTYSVSVSNITSDGSVVVGINNGAVIDVAGNVSGVISADDNVVVYDTTAPSVTINKAAGQGDPTNVTPINFTVLFSEPVTGFTNTDISLAGSTINTAGVTRTVTGSASNYNLAIGNAFANGQEVVASVIAGAVQDAAGNVSVASTSTDNSVLLDNIGPVVTINQAPGQADPTNTLPVNYRVVFGESVTGFEATDISFAGSSVDTSQASITITGSGTTYNVAIGNIPPTSGGLLRVSVRAGAVTDIIGNLSAVSTSTDNTIFIDTTTPAVFVNQAIGQADPTQNLPIAFRVDFTEAVIGFQASDISFAGSTANVSSATVSISGSGTFYTVSVNGVTSSGRVIVSIPAGAVQDAAGNQSLASVSTDNSVGFIIRGKAFDFDGDRKTDVGIFRPSVGEWWIHRSTTGAAFAAQFGAATDQIAPADFTGDGKTDIAFFRPSTGEWFVLRSEDSSYFSFPFGTDGDIVAPADYDGDGRADPTVFRPSTGSWFISRSTDGGTTSAQFGGAGDIPVVADYDGDGKADIAIYHPSAGEWWLNRTTAGLIVYQFGNSSDKTVQGDYTGDGKADVAFWRPSTGEWFVIRSENTSYFSAPFGTNGDIPAPGDYDGDGKFDVTVFRPTSGMWFVNRTSGGTTAQLFGQNGDRPLPSAFGP